MATIGESHLYLLVVKTFYSARVAASMLIYLIMAATVPQLHSMSVLLFLRIFFWNGVRGPASWRRVCIH